MRFIGLRMRFWYALGYGWCDTCCKRIKRNDLVVLGKGSPYEITICRPCDKERIDSCWEIPCCPNCGSDDVADGKCNRCGCEEK